MMKQADLDEDGFVSFSEFCSILSSGINTNWSRFIIVFNNFLNDLIDSYYHNHTRGDDLKLTN